MTLPSYLQSAIRKAALAYSDDSTRELFAQRLTTYCTTGPIPKDEGEAAELIARAVRAIGRTL
jgi:hypothetical protein